MTKTDWFIAGWFISGGLADLALFLLKEDTITDRLRYWTEKWPPLAGIIAGLLTLAFWHLFVEDLYWRLRK